jgi:hypothetical protein
VGSLEFPLLGPLILLRYRVQPGLKRLLGRRQGPWQVRGAGQHAVVHGPVLAGSDGSRSGLRTITALRPRLLSSSARATRASSSWASFALMPLKVPATRQR